MHLAISILFYANFVYCMFCAFAHFTEACVCGVDQVSIVKEFQGGPMLQPERSNDKLLAYHFLAANAPVAHWPTIG